MKKRDFLLISCIVIVMFLLILIIKMTSERGVEVVIYQNKKEYQRLSIYQDRKIKIKVGTGYNIVNIQDGEVWISDASCPDQICVQHRKISNSGEVIVCLPNKIVVEVQGKKINNVDSIVK